MADFIVTSLKEEYEKELQLRIKQVVSDCTDLEVYIQKEKGGDMFYSEIYADYRDELTDKDAQKILNSNEPMQTLEEMLYEWYEESEWDLESKVRNIVCEDAEVQKIFEKLQNSSSSTRNYDISEYCLDNIREIWYVRFPEEHFLSQDVKLDIVVDAGDANHDFCCNNILNYCGNGEIDEHSSILWLCKQQGKEKDFRDAIANVYNEDANYVDRDKQKDKFIESIVQELENLSTQLGGLTFCVECTLEEAIELKEKVESKKGTLVISKTTECGLYDPWNGSGSCLEIELDKDVEIPMEMIHSALPDGCLGYSIDSIYAPTNIWRNGKFEVKGDDK